MYNYNGIEYDAYQAIEVTIPGMSGGQTGTIFNFQDQPYLRPDSADIVAIETYTINTLTNGTVSGTPVASVAITKTASLTLYGGKNDTASGRPIKQGNQIIQAVPVLKLNNIQNASTDPFTREIFKLNEIVVDWTKSYVQLSAAPANTTNICLCFGIYFNWKKQFN